MTAMQIVHVQWDRQVWNAMKIMRITHMQWGQHGWCAHDSQEKFMFNGVNNGGMQMAIVQMFHVQ